ncbi:MAG: hypothetical protein AB7E72_16860 [Lysobacterales bacterium]
MNAMSLMFVRLLLVSGSAMAADDYTKTIERPEGPLTITWGAAPALPDQGVPDFDALDSNQDRGLSLTETVPHRLLHSDFIHVDANRNGLISRAELKRWH